MPALDQIGVRFEDRIDLRRIGNLRSGARSPLAPILIAISACLRHWLGGTSDNPFIKPFAAALLAGIIGAIAVRLHLNGTIDLARARIAVGASRVAYIG